MLEFSAILVDVSSHCKETFKWAMQRKVFGKPLIEQPVIREKLAQMLGAKQGFH